MEEKYEKFNNLAKKVICLGADKAEIEAWRKLWEFLDDIAKEEIIENLSNQIKELETLK